MVHAWPQLHLSMDKATAVFEVTLPWILSLGTGGDETPSATKNINQLPCYDQQ